MDFDNDEHLDVCQNIEAGLCEQYELHPELTDTQCIFALDNAKIAVKKKNGYAKNEKVTEMEEVQGIIEWCVKLGVERIEKVNNLTLKEYVARIEKIKRSVKRHKGISNRAYYDFIKQYV